MSPRLCSCMKPMSTTTASEKVLGRPFLFRTLCSRSTPQDLTLHTDGDHPVDVAGRCHLPSFGVMGEKQRLCESQELQQALYSHTSSVVFFTPAMCGCVQGELKTCMSGQLVTGTEGLMGMILGVLNQKQGGQQANQITKSGSPSPQHTPSLRSCMAWLPWKGCWKTGWHVRNAELKPRVGDSHKN